MVLPRWLRHHPFIEQQLNELITRAEELLTRHPEEEVNQERVQRARLAAERNQRLQAEVESIPIAVRQCILGEDVLLGGPPEPVENPTINVPNLVEGSIAVSITCITY